MSRLSLKHQDIINALYLWSAIRHIITGRRWIQRAALLLSLTVVVSCVSKEEPCYTGLSAETTPNELHIVERADQAIYYRAKNDDARLKSLSPLHPDVVLDEEGYLITPWVSCQDIDGFEDVERIDFSSVIQHNDRVVVQGSVGCISLSFRGSTNVNNIGFEADSKSNIARRFFDRFPLQSEFKTFPFIFDGFYKEISSGVFISHIAEEGVFAPDRISSNPYKVPKNGRSAFTGKGDRNTSPPFVIVRLWSFNTSKAQELAVDLLGEEVLMVNDDGEVTAVCGDVYYGYFEK